MFGKQTEGRLLFVWHQPLCKMHEAECKAGRNLVGQAFKPVVK